jgi:Cu(I)/Ag(I) efflux system membrane protein CusA/SilA
MVKSQVAMPDSARVKKLETPVTRLIGLCASNELLILSLVAASCLWGAWAMMHLPLDATPDLSETQVTILCRWDRSPDIIEDQVTYPIIAAMTGAPRIRTVRGITDFGFSYIYVIFKEGTDIYWARARTLEYLAGATSRLPRGSKPRSALMRPAWAGFFNTS